MNNLSTFIVTCFTDNMVTKANNLKYPIHYLQHSDMLRSNYRAICYECHDCHNCLRLTKLTFTLKITTIKTSGAICDSERSNMFPL